MLQVLFYADTPRHRPRLAPSLSKHLLGNLRLRLAAAALKVGRLGAGRRLRRLGHLDGRLSRLHLLGLLAEALDEGGVLQKKKCAGPTKKGGTVPPLGEGRGVSFSVEYSDAIRETGSLMADSPVTTLSDCSARRCWSFSSDPPAGDPPTCESPSKSSTTPPASFAFCENIFAESTCSQLEV